MPSTTTQTISAIGAWQPLLATTGVWLVTADDNFHYCWSEGVPPEAMPGHFERASQNIRVQVLAAETFYVRLVRATRFTVTPEV